MAQFDDLSDEQWCFLDLLMRAKERGVDRLSRMEILHSSSLPQAAAMKLTWAGLTMPDGLVTMIGQHDFQITDAGVSLYRLRFGQEVKPTEVADAVICLPDLSARQNAN